MCICAEKRIITSKSQPSYAGKKNCWYFVKVSRLTCQKIIFMNPLVLIAI